MIVADTSIWIDYFNGKITQHTDTLDNVLTTEMIIIGDLLITEILQGFRNEKDFNAALKLFEKLEYQNLAGYSIALKSAHNYRVLRSNGITIRKTIDIIIGTFCIENNYSLLHNDRDFDPMEKILGLKVFH